MHDDWHSILNDVAQLTREIFKNAEDSKAVKAKVQELQKRIESIARPDNGGPSPEHIGLLTVLRDPDVSLNRLLALTQTPHDARKEWYSTPEAVCRLAERLLDRGEPMLAFDVISVAKSEDHFRDELRVDQLEALALTRCGSIDDAINILKRLSRQGHCDEETLVLLAGAYRDLGIETEGQERKTHFRDSYECYVQAYSSNQRPWIGDRAAILGFLIGLTKEARKYAEEVRAKSEEELMISDLPTASRFWSNIAIGNAAMIRGRSDRAKHYYSTAAQLATGRFGMLSSAMKYARLLANSMSADWTPLRETFGLPNVVVFAGHMIDRQGRLNPPRFPEPLSAAIREEILERLRKANGRIGFASAACGGDTLFHEAIKELNGESHVVLPCNKQEFLARSVLTGGASWEARAHAVLESARVTVANEHLTDRGVAYEYSNRVLHGLAAMKARQLDTGLKFLAVWDGEPGHGPGGTSDHVNRWRSLGLQVDVINPRDFFPKYKQEIASLHPWPPSNANEGFDFNTASSVEIPAQDAPASPSRFPTMIAALYFADVANFSKLSESQLPNFVDKFLQLAADLLKKIEAKGGVLRKNTWGDGIYIAFRDPRDAGNYALDLRDEVERISWAVHGLPHDLNLRASLHAGPVFRGIDPMTDVENCMGSHVSKTARIEPITPKGEVYSSQEFAALATVAGIKEFECHYIGLREYAKSFGVFPTYHVRRRRSQAAGTTATAAKPPR